MRPQLIVRDDLVRLIYLDEAGISNPAQEPFLVVAGVLIHGDKQWKLIEGDLVNLAADTIPEVDRIGFIFHASELFSGGKYFTREKWPRETRWKILGRLVEIVQKHHLPVVCGFVHRERHSIQIDKVLAPERLDQKRKNQIAHGVAYMMCALRAEKWMKEYGASEVAMFIAEDSPHVKKYVKALHRHLKDPDCLIFKIEDLPISPLTKIIDTIHFAEKNETSVLQLADICAFLIKRKVADKNDIDQFLEPIMSQIIWPIDDPDKVYFEMRGA